MTTRAFLLIAITLCFNSLFAQNFTLANEKLMFSFTTTNGKIVAVSKDKANKYIIYRFGTKDKIEFEFSSKDATSWNDFTYSYFLRGGGSQNEAMDLNYLYFTNKEYQYVIYDNYVTNGNQVGIKIINTSTKKVTNIKGIAKGKKGSLVDCRDNDLLKKGEDMFE